jgi:signal transduction histidine kinase
MYIEGDRMVTEVKNISRDALDFDTQEITERFTRGDRSRNTEGSGLGLAIAKSFTELQGGSFRVETDGDLFKAIVAFPYQP